MAIELEGMQIVAENAELLWDSHYDSQSSGLCFAVAVVVAGIFVCSFDCAVVPIDSRSGRCSSDTLVFVAVHCSGHTAHGVE